MKRTLKINKVTMNVYMDGEVKIVTSIEYQPVIFKFYFHWRIATYAYARLHMP